MNELLVLTSLLFWVCIAGAVVLAYLGILAYAAAKAGAEKKHSDPVPALHIVPRTSRIQNFVALAAKPVRAEVIELKGQITNVRYPINY